MFCANGPIGYWGSYKCDVPVWTFEDMLIHIRETHLDVSSMHSVLCVNKKQVYFVRKDNKSTHMDKCVNYITCRERE
jgi:hypothetical protein